MANVAKLDSVYIPNVTAIEMTPEVIMDEARTASGVLRRDVVAVKRKWKLTASYLSSAEASAILDLLSGKSYGAVAFWLDEFGAESNTVTAYVTIDRRERVQFTHPAAGWQTNGATIEMTITEA